MSDVDSVKAIKLGLLFSLSFVFLPSLGFYAANPDGFSVDPTRLSIYLAVVSLVITAIVTLILLISMLQGTMLQGLSGFINGIGAMALIQGNFLLWNFGPLDGRGINWEIWKTEAHLEIAGWLMTLVAFTFIGLRSPYLSTRLTNILLLVCVAFTLPILVSLDFRTSDDPPQDQLRSPFIFHEKNNKILIVLDTMQSDIFGHIHSNYPEDLNFLTDFTFFPNTVGGYPTTKPSVSLILTGKAYQNQMPMPEWISKNVAGNTVLDFYEEQNFGVSVVSNGAPAYGVSQNILPMDLVDQSGWRRDAAKLFPVADAGLFRVAPTLLKPKIYEEGGWLLSNSYLAEKIGGRRPTDPPGALGADVRFSRAMQNGLSTNSEFSGEIKYFHMRGAHAPLTVDENFQYVEDGLDGSRESWVQQSRGALKNLRTILGALKSKSIYRDAEILVVGDHGTMGINPEDWVEDEDYPPIYVGGSARPLFLYKSGSRSGTPLKISDEPLHLADSACILSDWRKFCAPGFKSLIGLSTKRPRKFFHYSWGHDYWGEDLLPPLTAYVISGDVRHETSWALAPESRNPLDCQVPLDLSGIEPNDDISVKINPRLKLGPIYFSEGLSQQEKGFRWSDGQKVKIWFYFSRSRCLPSAVRISASAFDVAGYPAQRGIVSLNGVEIGEMSGSPSPGAILSIDRNARLEDGLNYLEFRIPTAISPKAVGMSNDPRELGFAFRTIEFVD